MLKQKWQWAVLLKAGCTKELSPEIYVSVKEGGTSNSLRWSLSPLVSLSAGLSLSLSLLSLSLSLSLSLFLSLSLSLSLSNKTRIYWNVAVFAFQTQSIQRLLVRNNIDTSLLIRMYIVFHFWTVILHLSSNFSTLSALISINWIVHFRIKFAEKVFLQYLPHTEPTQGYHFMV